MRFGIKSRSFRNWRPQCLERVDETNSCSHNFTIGNGTHTEQPFPENGTCQYTFDMTDQPSFEFLYITFDDFSLATRDYVTVFSNFSKPRAMIGNFTGSRTSFMVASSTNITSVRLVARPDHAKLLRQLSFSWNTVCEQTLEAPAAFASPVFIARASKSNASMQCDYTLLPYVFLLYPWPFFIAGLLLIPGYIAPSVSGCRSAALVSDNYLDQTSNLAESTDDVVIGGGLVNDTAIVTVTLNASIYQKGLAGSFISLTPDCSGNVTLKAGEQYQFASPGFPGVFNHAASCRLLIQTIEPNTTLVARIDVLGLVDDYDIVVVKDGRSKMSPTIVQIDKGFSTDYVIMSSNDSLWFEFTSEASLSPKSFSFNISVQYFGGTFEQSGSIMLNQSKVPAGGARNLKEYYKLVVAGDSQVYLNVSNAIFVPSNSNLKFYNGDRVDGNQLISKLLKSSTIQPVFSDGNVMLVVAEGFSGAKAFFNAIFKTEKKGCYQHSWEKSDSYSLLPGHEPENCSWLIHSPANIKKDDLLSVDLTHVRSASASIYNNAAPSTLVMALNASQLSTGFTVYMDAAKGARIQYVASSGNPSRLAIFEASYHVRKACDGYHNSTSGQVRSPGHPNLYPLNANCSYMLGLDQQKDKSLVYLSFRALQISSGHVLKVR
ncbi:PREDICTED: cubilin-like [Priapulus caudatus]|uniref:Cubilin-like n=1 Tax=Priapulus caudatus TaxID=37621 RepID=A0ABM1EV11_PRICU|nr:PREDICTED: cubilin-like [Priapulus caudatus]